MSVIPSGWAQCNFKMGGDGMPNGCEVTFGVRLITTDPPDVVATTIDDLTQTRLKDRLPSTIQMISLLVKFGPNATGAFHELGTGWNGSGSGGNVNPNMAMLIRKTTATGGRKGRGRWYWPVAEDQVDQAGILKASPDQVTAMNEALVDWMQDLVDADLPHYLLHSQVGDAPSLVTAMSTQALTATQRRRLRR